MQYISLNTAVQGYNSTSSKQKTFTLRHLLRIYVAAVSNENLCLIFTVVTFLNTSKYTYIYRKVFFGQTMKT